MPGFEMRLPTVLFAGMPIGAALVCGISGVSASGCHNYTDQEVVEAVHLGVGPIAKELDLPEIPAGLEAEHDAHGQEFLDIVVDRLSTDPSIVVFQDLNSFSLSYLKGGMR